MRRSSMRAYFRIASSNAACRQTACRLLIGVMIFLCAPVLHAAPCDLKVIVKDYQGRPVRFYPQVRALGLDGHQIAEAKVLDGVAEICDVGIKDFSLVVGNEMCGQVTVRLLYIRKRPLVVPVFYENCHGFRVPTGCHVLLRIQSSDGSRLAGATVSTPVLRAPRQSDAYGRVELYLPKPPDASHYQISVVKPNFRSQVLTIPCARGDTEIEQSVVLQPATEDAR